MRPLRLLPERWQKFLHEAFKFGIVGGINAIINYAVFNALALTVLRDGQLKATVIATIVATISSYFMNRHWTYRDRPKSALRRETTLFFLFNATGLVIEVGVLAVAKYGFGLTGLLALNLAKTFGVLLATLFRFWSYRTFVFQPAPAADAYAATPTTTGPVVVAALADGPTPDGERPDTTPPTAAPAAPAADGPTAQTAATGGADQPDGVAPRAGDDPDCVPLEIQFADTMNVALEAELATELNAELDRCRRPAGH
jgi:putative flippase GtrA